MSAITLVAALHLTEAVQGAVLFAQLHADIVDDLPSSKAASLCYFCYDTQARLLKLLLLIALVLKNLRRPACERW